MVPILWLAAAAVLFIVEGLQPGLVCLWFAFGALAAWIAQFFVSSVPMQVMVFLICSILFLLLLRPWSKRFLHTERGLMNADALPGKTGTVTKAIDNAAGEGQVTVEGKVWTARAAGPEAALPEGAKVRVLRIEGVKLIVETEKEA